MPSRYLNLTELTITRSPVADAENATEKNASCIDAPGIDSTDIDAPEIFAQVQALNGAVLLDTCKNTLSDGRFDILSYSPLFTYRFKQQKAKIDMGQITDTENAQSIDKVKLVHSPFEDLARLHDWFCTAFALSPQCQSKTDELPFLAGAIGLFAYDINTLTDHIQDDAPNQYALDDIAVGFYSRSLIFDNIDNKVYFVHPTVAENQYRLQTRKSANTQKPKHTPHSLGKADIDWLDRLGLSVSTDKIKDNKVSCEFAKAKTKSHVIESGFSLTSEWQSNMTRAQYHQNMQKIDAYLRAGDCYQVNFAQRFSATYTGSEWDAYLRLRKINKAPFSCFMRLKKSVVLSVSPERFLQLKEGKVITKPIKGTRKRAKNADEDAALAEQLLHSEKDRAENLMIVDLLRNDLSKHCKAHSVKVPHLFKLESYPAVHHMVSTVVGELKDDSNPFLLLSGAFPGGSITGAPKVRAMQIIQELEPDKRAIYCGSIGYVGIRDDMDTNICIRTLLAENQRLYCWAGGGIVLDSEAEDEYQESFHKVSKILPSLAETRSKWDENETKSEINHQINKSKV